MDFSERQRTEFTAFGGQYSIQLSYGRKLISNYQRQWPSMVIPPARTSCPGARRDEAMLRLNSPARPTELRALKTGGKDTAKPAERPTGGRFPPPRPLAI